MRQFSSQPDAPPVGTFCAAYPSAAAARRAAESLRRSGSAQAGVRVLVGSALHDVRREPAGSFAGPVAPTAIVGTYAGTRRLRRQGRGSFTGNPDRQRQGSFADVDRVVIVPLGDGDDRARVTGELALQRLLRGAALDDATVEHVIDELHSGHAVVLADLSKAPPGDARSAARGLGQAA